LAAAIQTKFADAEVTLVPGGKGDFIVNADGRELWSKREVGRFPEHDEILGKLVP
tara:strand:+ start:199735 stop:199899 length:165 start_codon:yes stop_codon:yes gene_type:complete